MKRPDDLPDFERPPLSEVVLGIQISPPDAPFSLYAGKVADLYVSDFPKIEEQAELRPYFETFGSQVPKQKQLRSSRNASPHGRLLMASQDGSRLIQFQHDRLIINWRHRGAQSIYPRFESIFHEYKLAIDRLQGLHHKLGYGDLAVDQCEVTYVNFIPLKSYAEAGEWLNFIAPPTFDLESLRANFVEVIKDDSGAPYARMYFDTRAMVHKANGDKAIRLMLTVRGHAKESTISAACQFIEDARENIVRRFAGLTTNSARQYWRMKV